MNKLFDDLITEMGAGEFEKYLFESLTDKQRGEFLKSAYKVMMQYPEKTLDQAVKLAAENKDLQTEAAAIQKQAAGFDSYMKEPDRRRAVVQAMIKDAGCTNLIDEQLKQLRREGAK